MARFLIVLVGFASLAFVPEAAGATVGVNSTADGTGSCVAGGTCTLRAAIQLANASPGADEIVLPAGHYTLTIPGSGEDASASGDLDVTDDLTITGAGARTTLIDGGGLDRVIDVPDAGARLALTGVSVTGGADGGIRSLGSLTLVDDSVTANSGGSGIAGFGPLTVGRSTVAGNTTGGDGGGILADPGSSGSTTVVNSTIANNTSSAPSGMGGGIAIESGGFTLQNDTIAGNSQSGASGEGGGLGFGVSGGRIRNTIVADNGALTGPDCGPGGGPVDTGHDVTGTECGFDGTGDSVADPLLGPFGNNGGPGDTMRIMPFTPAADHAEAASCPATDERGGARPQGTGCDIGAYEFGALSDLAMGAATATPRVVPLGGEVALGATVQILGPDVPQPSISITASLPNGLRPDKTLVDYCLVNTGVTCAFGSGPGITPSFHYIATRPGTYTVTLAAASHATDPNTANNSSSVTFRVKDFPCHAVKRGNRHANRLRGTRYGDRLIGGPGNDRLFGYAGADCLSGGTGSDVLSGGSGNDVLNPGPGRDHVSGGRGNDRLMLREGSRDVADCGPGRDTAVVDRHDRVRHCERVIRRGR